jgi:hypothetical protein
MFFIQMSYFPGLNFEGTRKYPVTTVFGDAMSSEGRFPSLLPSLTMLESSKGGEFVNNDLADGKVPPLMEFIVVLDGLAVVGPARILSTVPGVANFGSRCLSVKALEFEESKFTMTPTVRNTMITIIEATMRLFISLECLTLLYLDEAGIGLIDPSTSKSADG